MLGNICFDTQTLKSYQKTRNLKLTSVKDDKTGHFSQLYVDNSAAKLLNSTGLTIKLQIIY